MFILLFDILVYLIILVKNIGGYDFILLYLFIYCLCKENGLGIVVLLIERRFLYLMFFIFCCFFDEGNFGNFIEYVEYVNVVNFCFGLFLVNLCLLRNFCKVLIFYDKKELKVKFLLLIFIIFILYICVK